MINKIRIGVVPYLNAKPLIYGLTHKTESIEFVFEAPSLLPGMLNNDQIDVALIPAIEYFRNDNCAIIPDISISSVGTVESVKIFSKVPLQDVHTIALDKSSSTSSALTRIIFSEYMHVFPQYTQWNKQCDISQTNTDAVLLIGDNAMKVMDNGYFTLDLGQAWFEYTGLPFVYAVWVVKRNNHITGINNLLKTARESGIKSINTIAVNESSRIQLTKERCLNYLTNSIRYYLGKEEIRGLQTFYDYAVALGLAPKGVEIVFNDT
ncbi:MAG TPA: menaquinone biosynthetic enzyme MqnA/MqnD family protein [Candidatus Wujingus californicus]|uniref:menaquinone biosynthetic enzyme MqnA/MqnD family protein n=2 Tax=Candidatus Wujingus californicus TaxID=3367618 RepID=UPI001D692DD2|nr:menaquinone biosynthesis protein [Planctomycetota bacterium]MDO8131785.1 menaquinone biosynthesis protein [Candidatus Brocadiales bacterium]